MPFRPLCQPAQYINRLLTELKREEYEEVLFLKMVVGADNRPMLLALNGVSARRRRKKQAPSRRRAPGRVAQDRP